MPDVVYLVWIFLFLLFSTTHTGPSGGTPLQEPYSWKTERGGFLNFLVRRPWTDPHCHRTSLRMWGTFIFQQGTENRKRTIGAAELTHQKCLTKKQKKTNATLLLIDEDWRQDNRLWCNHDVKGWTFVWHLVGLVGFCDFYRYDGVWPVTAASRTSYSPDKNHLLYQHEKNKRFQWHWWWQQGYSAPHVRRDFQITPFILRWFKSWHIFHFIFLHSFVNTWLIS